MVDRQCCKGMSLNDGRNLAMFSAGGTLEGSVCQRTGVDIEKALVPISVFTVGIIGTLKGNDRKLVSLTGIADDCCFHERVIEYLKGDMKSGRKPMQRF